MVDNLYELLTQFEEYIVANMLEQDNNFVNNVATIINNHRILVRNAQGQENFDNIQSNQVNDIITEIMNIDYLQNLSNSIKNNLALNI